MNAEQRSIATSPIGKMVVIAGAGTGKTTTLVHRIEHLLSLGSLRGTILMVTFTKRSAIDMKQRLIEVVGEGPSSQVTTGTIHGWCAKTLRRYAPIAMLSPKFSVLDEVDMNDVMSDVLAEMGHKRRESVIPKASRCVAIWSRMRNCRMELDALLEEEAPGLLEHRDEIQRVFNGYEDAKKKMNALDYDDVLLVMEAFLQSRPDVAAIIGRDHPHIIVDEYQDVNKTQASIINLIATEGSLMVVGDDAQSIYGFRGADVRIIREFTKHHPGASVSHLLNNYRSHQGILDFANEGLSHMTSAIQKKLTGRATENKPELFKHDHEYEQGECVASRIQSLLKSGVKPEQIGVLCRFSKDTMILENRLNSTRIPYVKYGGIRLDEMAHIKDILCLFRIIINPQDRKSWMRYLALLPGIGKATAIAIAEDAVSGKSWTRCKKASKCFDDLDELHQVMTSMAASSPQEAARLAIKHYDPLMEMKYDDHLNRRPELAIISTMMDGYHELVTALDGFILERPEVDRDSHDRLVISTIHSAKGLEWEYLFIINTVEGTYPALKSMGNEDQMEEERRLWYVAVTRAKKGLSLHMPGLIRHYDGSMYPVKISRFIEEGGDSIDEK